MATEAEKTRALDSIRRNIDEHGFHAYIVAGGGDPHYAYTIGLGVAHGAELVLAGTYYYSLKEIPEILHAITVELAAEQVSETRCFDLGPRGSFSLRKVHSSWVSALMRGALDFYQVNDLTAFQIVDGNHWTIDVPNLSEPWSSTAAPAWQWLHEKWTYPVPLNSVGITNLAALRGEPITEVMRWEEDEWELFSEPGPDVPKEELRVVPLGTLIASDSSLDRIVKLSVGTGLRREGKSEWHPRGKEAGQDSAGEDSEG
jgi:hypothetical protein